MILHKILFFSLPYGETSTYDELSDKIKRYPG
jgi:O6-methylguanine-DNA--protein-cysteine methyltransferase